MLPCPIWPLAEHAEFGQNCFDASIGSVSVCIYYSMPIDACFFKPSFPFHRIVGSYHSCAMCTANHGVKLATAAFAALYAGIRVKGRSAFMDATFTIQPCPRCATARPNTWQLWNVPAKFRPKTWSTACMPRSKKLCSAEVVACGWLPPAALIKISTGPRVFVTCFRVRSRTARSRTS